MHDPIVDEVRKNREEIFKRCHHDLAALVKYLQKRQKANHRKTVRLPPKKTRAA